MALRFTLSIFSGLLFAFSFPDIAIGWLMLIAFIPLLVAIVRARGWKEAFLLGWLAHTTSWLIMVPWVVRVMSYYGGLPYFTGVLIFIAMSIYLGIYGAFFAVIVYGLKLDHRLRFWLLVPAAWAAVEYVRTYAFTGFPWNLIAAALIDYAPLIQIDRFAGPYFVAALMLFPTAVIAWLLTQAASTPKRIFAGASVVVILFIWWTTGYVSLAITRVQRQPAKAAMLQPNISQQMRWDERNLVAIFQRMIDMTNEAVRNGAEVVIWPESTVPLSYSREDFYRETVESISRSTGVDIILGSVAEDPGKRNYLWNAAFLVSGGKTIGHYDKIRLVPFGEYVPMRKMLFFAEKLVREVGEFQFGEKDTPLEGKFLYGPAICYEIVYPQITRTQVRNGANVLVTITNDAWYDGTSAPRQHLNQARLRAVEDDRYLLRAGTTGISAIVDPTGRIVEEIPMGRQGILYATFEGRETVTPYVKYGDWFAWVAVAGVFAALLIRRK